MYLKIIILVCVITFNQYVIAQDSISEEIESPISIDLVKYEEISFATINNVKHQENQIGYRFHFPEHQPVSFGTVPLSDKNANINIEELENIEAAYKNTKDIFIYEQKIEKNEYWYKQDWIYYLRTVHDGIEILLIVKTYDEGLPEYYGVQQCFQITDKKDLEWIKKIACDPAFSECDLWEKKPQESKEKKLTYILRDNKWQVLPASENPLGARTPVGIAIDDLRNNGQFMSAVGYYKAQMLNPIDNGLMARIDSQESWVSGIYWQNTSHVINHHPADCLHSIINIGNIPPFSKKAILGKIYWFNGNKDSLYNHYKKDIIEGTIKNKLVIASCQFPVSGNISENANWIHNQMKRAKLQGAEIIHFPECALSGYAGADFKDYSAFDWDKLIVHTDSILLLTQKLKLWVILGSSHRLSNENKPHNSLYLINPEGKIIDRYDKRFCTIGDLEHYTPGDHFVEFEVNNIKCGLLICYDLRFPELFREYRKIGADVVFHSFYNARRPYKNYENSIYPRTYVLTTQERAATNYFFISTANSSAPYSWPCYFITPDGQISNNLDWNKPGILISEVNIITKYTDGSKPFRMDAINGKLNSGEIIQDPRSQNRYIY